MNAYIKALQYFNDKGMAHPSVVKILRKYTKVPEKLILKGYPLYLPADGAINLASLEHQLKWYKQMGFTKANVTWQRALNDSFRQKAVKKLSGK